MAIAPNNSISENLPQWEAEGIPTCPLSDNFGFRKARPHWLSYLGSDAAAVLCCRLNDLMRYQRSQIIDCINLLGGCGH